MLPLGRQRYYNSLRHYPPKCEKQTNPRGLKAFLKTYARLFALPQKRKSVAYAPILPTQQMFNIIII